jgi:predicted DsbA family dithiol-disulfide isomerase
MNDKLLQRQEELTTPELTRYAEELGLDVERFWDDLRRREHADRVGEDVATADASGVAGTPSFFINGRRHQGAYDVQTLTAAVRAARTRVRARETAARPLTSLER